MRLQPSATVSSDGAAGLANFTASLPGHGQADWKDEPFATTRRQRERESCIILPRSWTCKACSLHGGDDRAKIDMAKSFGQLGTASDDYSTLLRVSVYV